MDWKVIEPTEMDEVVELLDASFPVDKDYIKRALAEIGAFPHENIKIYRLRIGDVLVATATYGQYFDGSWNGASYLRFLAVHPDHRRKGYASWIIQKIIDDTQAVGSPSLNVSVLQSDRVCAGIWKRRGFELYDTSPDEDYPEHGLHDYYGYRFNSGRSLNCD